MSTHATDPQPTAAGNLVADLDALLAHFGVERASTQDQITELATTALAARGHTVEIVGLRHGTLTLSCDQITASLLRYDTDPLLAELEAAFPGVVTRITVRSQPQRRRR